MIISKSKLDFLKEEFYQRSDLIKNLLNEKPIEKTIVKGSGRRIMQFQANRWVILNQAKLRLAIDDFVTILKQLRSLK